MMRKALQLFVLCLAGVSGSACHRLIPTSRPPFTITGIVQAMDADALSLRHKSGQVVRIAIAPRTTVSRDAQPAALADVHVGMRIVVWYHFTDGAAVADDVRLFRPAIKPGP
jgi:hypothetical protein